jgi:hypothetical protein
MKIIAEGMMRHLCLKDQTLGDLTTLCGCTITQSQSWKRVRSVEGDEYPQCAELAFGGQRTRKTSLGEIVFASAQ